MENMTDFELELFIRKTEEEGLLQAPERMKDEIMKKSQGVQTKAVRQVTKAAVRAELMIYGLKTAAAVAAAIFLFSLICHPTLQAAVLQNTVWEQEAPQERTDGREQWRNMLSDVLERANRKMWQYTGGYQGIGTENSDRME